MFQCSQLQKSFGGWYNAFENDPDGYQMFLCLNTFMFVSQTDIHETEVKNVTSN